MDKPTHRLHYNKNYMVQDGMDKQNTLINVGIYSDKEQHFRQYSTELLEAGFNLSATNDAHHVCIVELQQLHGNQDFWIDQSTPYLVSDVSELHQASAILRGYPNVVGFLNDIPSAIDITLNLTLGLHWFNERENYSNRLENMDDKINNNRTIGVAVGALVSVYGGETQNVFEKLKLVSRNKQRRLVDVAADVLASLTPSDNSPEKLDEWLDSHISVRK